MISNPPTTWADGHETSCPTGHSGGAKEASDSHGTESDPRPVCHVGG